MTTVVRNILFTGALAMAANGLFAAQASNTWLDQWYKAKYGRISPAEEARLNAERESTAFREETPGDVTPETPNWMEQYFKAKLGRNTPAEEARLKAERESTAFREEPTRDVAPARTWLEERYRVKYGRSSPTEEARRKADGR